MMNTVCKPSLLISMLLSFLLVACQQQFVSGGSLGLRDFPDAVVHINQVDPAYRPYFAQQHGASYSLSDQRKAFSQARQTAKTPVRESAYRPAKAAPRKKTARSRGRVVSRGKNVSRGKSVSAGKKKKAATGKKSSAARKKAVPKKKSAARSGKRRR
ncbi:MAG: hypothetical protein IKZ07_05170 [Akkermansia sp.]|nr:hypothetical protein [Akkermansia sp.]